MKYALITGASRGLGAAFATVLAERGYNLLLVARSGNDLQELSENLRSKFSINVSILSIDLSIPGSAGAVADWVHQHKFPVSILVNNAGYGLWGNFDEQELNAQIALLQVNIISLVELTHKLIPVISSSKGGYILNVSSTTAYQSVPTMAAYSAAKSFILSFSRSLSHELKRKNIGVSCISPGPIDTDFIYRAGLDFMVEKAKKFNMSPIEVARIGIRGMLKGKVEIIPGIVNLISAKLTYFSPKALNEKIAASLYKK